MQRIRIWPTTLLAASAILLSGCEPELIDMARNSNSLGCCGLIILILDIIAIVEVAGSHRTLRGKLLWALFIVFFPILGLIIYYVFAQRN